MSRKLLAVGLFALACTVMLYAHAAAVDEAPAPREVADGGKKHEGKGGFEKGKFGKGGPGGFEGKGGFPGGKGGPGGDKGGFGKGGFPGGKGGFPGGDKGGFGKSKKGDGGEE